jgi:hypothetical protein
MANNIVAYGFIDHAGLMSSRVSDVGVPVMYDAVQASARYHTEQLNKALDRLCLRTDKWKWRFKLPEGGEAQPITDLGKPDVSKGDTSYDVALPIANGGSGLGLTWLAAEKITVEELNAKTVSCLMKDSRWAVRRIIAALLTNASWTYSDPEHGGNLTIQTLANADGTLYPINGDSTEDSQHFLADANAIADAHNHYDTIYDQLKKHPSNNVGDGGGDVVCYIASDLVGNTKNLTDFRPVGDTDVALGANSDQLVASAARIATILGPGDEVLGKVGRTWVVEWKRMPSTYIIGQALGAGPVLGFREEPEASLQGLMIKRDEDPFKKETYFLRRAGFGVINRVAAVAFRVGNGSYAIPSGYSASLLG